ncbi:MAG: response regulator [Lentisphaerae bacterium]|nr:response regulator [Lentisphaerota bacterium]
MTKVAIIDDHDLLRFGLKTVLSHSGDLEFVGERPNGEGASAFLKEVGADVVVLDLRMPVVDGLAALEDIRANAPGVKVLVLTTSDVEEDILSVHRIGVEGYALKTLSPKAIVDAIRAVARGERFLSEEVRAVLESYDSSGELSTREREILEFMSKGLSNPDIAKILGISAGTIKKHAQHLYDKMGVSDRAEAVARAFARGLLKVAFAGATVAFALGASADIPAPLFHDAYTADPAPLVSGGRMYLYVGHDADDADRLKMPDWMCYSTADGTNWVSHGVVASPTNFSWAAENRAWAAQCVERNGKFYLYTSGRTKNGANAVGVLVTDSPSGPFHDPIGRPLVARTNGDIDPTVLVDDDGKVYLYWGLADLYVARLSDDMISFDTSFGTDGVFRPGRPRYYHSGPWVWKRGGKYYMAYSSRKIPVGVAYATADAPEGPWTFVDWFVQADVRSPSTQVGIAEFLGKSWIFGYNYELYAERTPAPRPHRERRSVWMLPLEYIDDGRIREVTW